MMTEAIQQRFATDDGAARTRPGLSSLPPIGRLGLVVLIGGWGLLVLPAIMAGAGLTEVRVAATVLARLGESAIITGVALAVLALLVHMATLRVPLPASAGRPVASAPAAVAGLEVAAAPMPLQAAAAARFETIVSAPPAASPAAPPAAPAPAPVMTAPALAPAAAPAPAAPASRPTASASVSALPLGGPMVVVARGQVDDRGFLILGDGTLIIETLLGQRRFRTIADAREFIGGGRFVIHDTVQIALKGQGGVAPSLKDLAA
ncbi:MAG: hypothetical protein ACOYLQ_10675 [Hyphomicrobiaceae bacterium]